MKATTIQQELNRGYLRVALLRGRNGRHGVQKLRNSGDKLGSRERL
jgi:hypothetical protein